VANHGEVQTGTSIPALEHAAAPPVPIERPTITVGCAARTRRALVRVRVPLGDAITRRLVNEIVLGEEPDEVGNGYASHFELYLAAMREAGADTRAIDEVGARVARGDAVGDALARAGAPAAARQFVESTFDVIASGPVPQIADAFTIDREEVIPDMFARIVADLYARQGARLGLFVDYLERHIRIDSERHAPMAARLLEALCGDDEGCCTEAYRGARSALRARCELWDGIQRDRGYAPATGSKTERIHAVTGNHRDAGSAMPQQLFCALDAVVDHSQAARARLGSRILLPVRAGVVIERSNEPGPRAEQVDLCQGRPQPTARASSACTMQQRPQQRGRSHRATRLPPSSA
jgi:hypothetical protein